MLAAAALLLPAIIVLAVLFNTQQEEQRRNVERQARENAREIVALADAEIAADFRVLRVLATSMTLREGRLDEFRDRLEGVVRDNPDWTAVVLREAETGRVLVEVSRDAQIGARAALHPLPVAIGPNPLLEGVFRDGRYCPCLILHLPTTGARDYVMTLFADPARFQRILMAGTDRGPVTAIVDREGHFIARSLSFEERVGIPGSQALRGAVSRGGEGMYRGVTLEGFDNYTAYSSSPRTGLSTHIALGVAAIESPRAKARAALGIALFAALILAAGLVLYAAYEARRRRLEEQRLLSMQKAEAISRFTGTMTHDFRNILSVIDAGVRLIERHSGEPATLQRARAIGDAVERGNRLVNQLLSFVRGDGAKVERVDLEACLTGADELLARSVSEGVTFTWRVEADARYAYANADQLELALLNLAINASDAMSGQGKFSIVVERESDFAAIHACDNGPGVPPALRERIFEAFYSTKGEGGGTGLGLAQVAGAARQAGGRVELRDAPGGGACFSLYLPIAEPRDSGSHR